MTPAQPLVILGGGLAGLAASLASRAPVYEADEAPGGVAASDREEGYAFDRGIHVLQTRNARILKLLEESGVELNEHRRRAFIYARGVYTPYPFQVNTAGMPLSVRARCVWDFLRRDRRAQPRNYEEWMYASLGRGFAETFLIPYSEKFWTVHPREMTHEWTGNRVPQPSTLQVLRGALWARQTRIGTNVDFRYPRSAPGYGAVGEALARRAGPLRCGKRAIGLDLGRRTVRFADGTSVRFERMISTIPLPELVRLCTEAPPEVRAAAAKLRTNSILVVNIGVARPNLSDWHWAHYPEKEVSFFRISFPCNFADNVAPRGVSTISAEVAYSPARPLDIDATVRQVLADVVKVRVLRGDDRVVYTGTRNVRYAYCIYDFERKAAVRLLRDWLQRYDVVPAGRYGLWTYFWSDEAMMSGLQAAERLMKAACEPQREARPAAAR